MATTRSSSAAIAFTGSMARTACDIPKLHGGDSFTAVAARSVPTTTRKDNLLTPPNSISPSLPPHGLKARSASSSGPSNLDPIESDLDIHDGSAGSVSPQGFDATGAITPSLLAKHHLPDILLNNGPLAIRYIMGHLNAGVPGFSGIPPAKARRLVVGALEGRGSGGEGGGVDGNVKFEKVGWGRWDARMKGQAPRERGISPPASTSSSLATGIAINNSSGRTRLDAPSQSWATESAVFSHDDIDMMEENEADKMSLDGDESCSSSDAPPDEDVAMGDDIDDLTDEEDWAALGAAALRQSSYTGTSTGRKLSHVYTAGSYGNYGLTTMSKSVPFQRNNGVQREQQTQRFNFSALGATTPSQEQEREAIEALLRLGSV